MGTFQHQNAVHVLSDLVHAVAHQNNGGMLIAVVIPDIGHQVLPAGRVQSGGGLVQHQHLGLHGDDARQGHPALLTAGELKGGFFQLVIPDAHQAGRLPDAGIQLIPPLAHVGGAKSDVLVYGLLEQLIFRILEHQAHLKAHIPDLFRLRPNIFSPQQHLAAGGLQQSVEMLDEGGFTGAGVADDA